MSDDKKYYICNFIKEYLEKLYDNGTPCLTCFRNNAIELTKTQADVLLEFLHNKGYTGLYIKNKIDAIEEKSNNNLKWIVGIQRPFYPEVEIFTNEIEADEQYKELLEENESEGAYESYVFKAIIVQKQDIKTDY